MKLLQYLCIPFLLVLTGCAGCEDDPLSFSKTEYTGNQLRTDGYYYGGTSNPDNIVSTYFFYRNGVIYEGDTFEYSRIEEKEQQWQSAEWQSAMKGSKIGWGVFVIEGNKIKFDCWYPSAPPYTVFTREGIILNDTTFEIKESYKLVDGTKTEVQPRNEIYRFKQFSPKPDSTNPFVVRF